MTDNQKPKKMPTSKRTESAIVAMTSSDGVGRIPGDAPTQGRGGNRNEGRRGAGNSRFGNKSGGQRRAGGSYANRSAGPSRGGNGGSRSFGGRGSGKGARSGQFIHPDKFVNKAIAQKEETPYEATHAFADFPFSNMLQDNIAAHGYVTPSAIQDQAITPALEGKDVIGLANTGTGKTAAFVLPMIERIQYGDKYAPLALIIAPTRELVSQIDEQFRAFSKGMKLYATSVVGGMNIERQVRELRRRPHVVIGTPGRLKDLINRRELNLSKVQVLVLDEADRMLDMGFLHDVRAIAGETPDTRQTMCFSATMTPAIQALIGDFTKDPVIIQARTSETSEHVEQDVVEYYDKQHKIELLSDMLKDDAFEKVLVFGQTKYGVQRLSDQLNKEGHSSDAIHGNKSQPQRQRALNKFRDNTVRILVATDVAARGLDIPNVSHVINFDQPMTYDDYIHRIGRTGRGGARGTALTFIEPRSRTTTGRR